METKNLTNKIELYEEEIMASKKCPRCGIIANGEEEIEEKFGYRNMGDGREEPIIPQSHCRKCRKEEIELQKIKNKNF
ncbi:hypothetical protein HMPREF9093_00014 [Fusobacterium sp. oral taxon 370 str. F0437]|uniref:hypothetical protein n=1 Tax=Fusobacterium sp. oral taxon 370 TaxID=712288 RepID=UPI000234B003|nr:hypothetical protein [Fusobacterium sp. oral taxon 370]EHI79711.1 hypothetical protein HMPREF9093_00014 [Fusobacterium sp. oral taxon 370 str. F0437]